MLVIIFLTQILSQSALAKGLVQSVPEALTKAPQDQEICFSPDEPCDEKLVNFIDSAQKSLEIAIYDINLDQLVHHILLQNKKIKVRIVVDERQAKGKHSSVPLLVKAGVNLRYGRQRGIMHDKFTIVDGKIIETGSFNYTHHAATANQENQIYSNENSVVSRFSERFDKIWSSAKIPGAKKH